MCSVFGEEGKAHFATTGHNILILFQRTTMSEDFKC